MTVTGIGAASPRLQPWVKAPPGAGVPGVLVVPGGDDVVMAYRSVNKTVYSAKYHLIWRPRCRRRVLAGAVEERLKKILAQVAGEVGAEVIEVEVMPDHHLLVEIPPPVALSRFVQLAKGRSSRLLRQEFPHLRRLPCLWSPSWFVSTVGGAPLEVVRRDVENQKWAA